jgi:hypothetical protein
VYQRGKLRPHRSSSPALSLFIPPSPAIHFPLSHTHSWTTSCLPSMFPPLTSPYATLTVQDTCRVREPRTMASCIRTATSASPRWPLHGSSTGLDGLLSTDRRSHSTGATRGRETELRMCALPHCTIQYTRIHKVRRGLSRGGVRRNILSA